MIPKPRTVSPALSPVPGFPLALAMLAVLCAFSSLQAQTTALRGRVIDESGAVIAAAAISVRDDSTGYDASVATEDRKSVV